MPQDVDAPSPASAGSQPVAWAVFEADGNCVGTYATQEHARIVMEELAYDGMVYEPLYRQPIRVVVPAMKIDRLSLTPVEWEALNYAADSMFRIPRLQTALLELLERLE